MVWNIYLGLAGFRNSSWKMYRRRACRHQRLCSFFLIILLIVYSSVPASRIKSSYLYSQICEKKKERIPEVAGLKLCRELGKLWGNFFFPTTCIFLIVGVAIELIRKFHNSLPAALMLVRYFDKFYALINLLFSGF